jgi:hypothetical protein
MLARVRKTANGVLIVTPPPGRWATSDSEEAIRVIESFVEPTGRYVFVADVSAMTGYDPAARTMWQSWMARRKRQLEAVWFVGSKVHPFVMMGIRAMSMFLRVDFHFARTLDEVPELRPGTQPGAPG